MASFRKANSFWWAFLHNAVVHPLIPFAELAPASPPARLLLWCHGKTSDKAYGTDEVCGA